MITKESFGITPEGREVFLYTLENDSRVLYNHSIITEVRNWYDDTV